MCPMGIVTSLLSWWPLGFLMANSGEAASPLLSLWGDGGLWGVLLLQHRMDGAQQELCPLLPGASQLFLSMHLITPLDMGNTTVQEWLLAKVSCALSPPQINGEPSWCPFLGGRRGQDLPVPWCLCLLCADAVLCPRSTGTCRLPSHMPESCCSGEGRS